MTAAQPGSLSASPRQREGLSLDSPSRSSSMLRTACWLGGYYGGYTGDEGKLREQMNTRPASAPPIAEAVYVTHDGGMTWEGPNNGLHMLGLSSSDFIDTQHGWAIQTSTSGPTTSTSILLTTSDSGQHWTTVPTSAANFMQSMPGSLNFVSSQIGWAVDQNSGGSILLKTEDGGHHLDTGHPHHLELSICLHPSGHEVRPKNRTKARPGNFARSCFCLQQHISNLLGARFKRA